MGKLRLVKLHDEMCLWPAHKSMEQVLELEATTPPSIWSCVYQGNPSASSEIIFQREWWEDGKNRFVYSDQVISRKIIARWISFDTAMKDKKSSAYSAGIVGELTPDYRLLIRHIRKDKVAFPDLITFIEGMVHRFNRDHKLRGIIIEDKASGISALQTLQKSAEYWIREILIPFNPPGSKEFRAELASVWCRNNMVLLPHPEEQVDWLFDFEDELYTFPGSAYRDQIDAFSQLILWTENLLAEGWQMRKGE